MQTDSLSDQSSESTESTPAPRGPGPAPGTRLDVVAVGNALVDVLGTATDEDLVALDLIKGTMVIVDQARSESIYATMGPTTEASGGSAANTVAGVAALGGRAAYLARVADDQWGQVFTHDIRSIGVAFDPKPTKAVPGRTVTGHCLVLMTEDAERTMATHLGVSSEFGPNRPPRRPPDLGPGGLSRGVPLGAALGQGGHAAGHRHRPR